MTAEYLPRSKAPIKKSCSNRIIKNIRMGDRSNPPNGGIICLTGAIIGSVSCHIKSNIG